MRGETMKRMMLSKAVKGYLTFGVLWIVLSDFFMSKIRLHLNTLMYAGLAKGLVMVILSGLLIERLIRKEEEIRHAKEAQTMITRIINYMPDVVCFKNMQGHWRQASEETLALFGIQSTDYRGKTDEELGVDVAFFEVPIAFRWDQESEYRAEKTMMTASGEERIYDVIQIFLCSGTNEKLGVLTMGRDITDLKKKEKRLMKSEKLLVVGELAAGIAHEIRNPLTSLKGFSQLLQDKYPEDDMYFSIMLTELERINEIVEEFLFIAKPNAVTFAPRNVSTILQETLLFLEAEATLYNVNMFLHVHTNHRTILGDNKQLKQVFLNILKNAIEAMPQGGTVTVHLYEKKGELVLSFQDTGIGMEKERIQKLGEPFFTTKEKGTGLGLMVSYKIIHAHNGTVQVYSEKGVGTNVTVTFPLA